MTKYSKLINTISSLVYMFSCCNSIYSKGICEESVNHIDELNINTDTKNKDINKLKFGIPLGLGLGALTFFTVDYFKNFTGWNIRQKRLIKNDKKINDKKFFKETDGIKIYLSNLQHWGNLISKYVDSKKYDEKRKLAIAQSLYKWGALAFSSEYMTDEGRLVAIKAVDIAISFIKEKGRQNSLDYMTTFNNSMEKNKNGEKVLSESEKKMCDITYRGNINYDCYRNEGKNITITIKCDKTELDYFYEIDLTQGMVYENYEIPYISLHIYKGGKINEKTHAIQMIPINDNKTQNFS